MQKNGFERFSKLAPYLGFGAALLILVVVNGYAVSSLNAVVRSNDRVAHSVEVINEIESLLEQITNAETSQNAYVITGDAAFLKPYRDAITPNGVALHLQRLRQLTADDPAQLERLDRLEGLIVKKFALTEQLIALRELYGFETARNLVANGTSQNAMGDVRDVIDEIDLAEDKLLKERTAAEDINVQTTLIALLSGAGLAALTSIATLVLIGREIYQRRQAEQSVRQLNNELEGRVHQRTGELEQANTSLREAESKYRALVEQLPAAIYIDAISTADPDEYHSIYASPYFETLLGLTTQEIIDQPGLWLSLLHPDDRRQAQALARQHHTTGEKLRQEYRMFKRDGSLIWIADESVMLPNSSGEWKHSQGIMLDITAQKQAELSVAQSEMRFRALTENGSDGITLLTAEGVVLYTSLAVSQILGSPADYWLGGNVFTRMHPDDLGSVSEVFGQLLQVPGSRRNATFRYRRQDDSWRWLEATATNLLDQPELNAIVLNFRDVTDIRGAQGALAASEQRFRALIENSTDAISLLGASGHLEYVSPSTTRILGYTSEEAIGGDPATLTHPDDLPILLPVLTELMEKPGESRTVQYRFRHKDGRWIWVEAFITNMLADPAVGAIVFNYRDITERREHERKMQALVTVSAALRVVSARQDMIPVILDQLMEVLNASGAVMETLMPATGELLVELGRGTWASATGSVIPAGGGLSAQVLDTSQYYLNNDARNDPKLFRPDLFGSCIGMMGVPMLANNQITGILWLCTERALTEHDVNLVAAIAELAANALQREAMHEHSVRQLQRLAALRDIDQAITGSVELRLTLDVILVQTRRQLNADAVSILLLNKSLLALEYAAGLGFRTKSFEKARSVRLGEGYAGRAALERRSILVQDLQKQTDNPRLAKALGGEGFVSYFGIPLIAKGRVIGVIEVFQRTPLNPEPDWLSFFEALAGQTAIAVEGAQLFEGLQRSNVELSLAYDATIEGWSRAMDLRDKETEGHTLRVTDMTLSLAAAMGMSAEEMVHIRRGALLHDIGKMGVPDNILLKPDKLTDDEWVHMRKHPEYAYAMLAPIDYLRPALDIPYCHHEKWDGTGYPRGLKGFEIPLSARIFAITDVWDALRSDRPYRKGWTEAQVLEHIKSLSGTHFDPQVVETFLNISFR